LEESFEFFLVTTGDFEDTFPGKGEHLLTI
jgi:hypothetical protein